MSRRLFVAGALLTFVGCGLVTGLEDYVIDGAGDPDAGEASTPPVVVNGRDAQTSPDATSTTPDADAPDSSVADTGASDATTTADADAGPTTCDEPGLIARWKFDEPSGLLVSDCTSHRYDGMLGGNVARGPGHLNNGITMDAGIVTFGTPAAFDLTTGLSICAWARVNGYFADPAFANYIAAKSKDVGTDGWRLGVDSINGVTFTVAKGGGVYTEIASGAFALGTWVHTCGTFQPGKIELYINGLLRDSSNTAALSILKSTNAFSVANRADNLRPFNGMIDEVRLYDRPVTAVEAAKIASE